MGSAVSTWWDDLERLPTLDDYAWRAREIRLSNAHDGCCALGKWEEMDTVIAASATVSRTVSWVRCDEAGVPVVGVREDNSCFRWYGRGGIPLEGGGFRSVGAAKATCDAVLDGLSYTLKDGLFPYPTADKIVDALERRPALYYEVLRSVMRGRTFPVVGPWERRGDGFVREDPNECVVAQVSPEDDLWAWVVFDGEDMKGTVADPQEAMGCADRDLENWYLMPDPVSPREGEEP
jgi:hypothetical protein